MVKMTVTIEGMGCMMCEKRVCGAISENFKVKKVEASFEKGCAEILAAEEIPADALKRVIEEAGYKALEVSAEPVKRGLFG